MVSSSWQELLLRFVPDTSIKNVPKNEDSMDNGFPLPYPERLYFNIFYSGIFSLLPNKDKVNDLSSSESEAFLFLVAGFNLKFALSNALVHDRTEQAIQILSTDIQDCEMDSYLLKFKEFVIDATARHRFALYQSIYSDLPVEYGKKLALRQSSNDIKSSDHETGEKGPNSTTYGEIEYSSFLYIMQLSLNLLGKKGRKSELVFTDLGHGTGKALVIMNLMYAHAFRLIAGVELLFGLYEESVNRINLMNNSHPGSDALNSDCARVLAMYGDFLESSFSKYFEDNSFHEKNMEYNWTDSGIVLSPLFEFLRFPHAKAQI